MFTHPRKPSTEIPAIKAFLDTSSALRHMRKISQAKDMSSYLRTLKDGEFIDIEYNFAKKMVTKIDAADSFARLIDITRKYSADPKETACNSLGKKITSFFFSYISNYDAFIYYTTEFRKELFTYMDKNNIMIDASKLKIKKTDVSHDILTLGMTFKKPKQPSHS